MTATEKHLGSPILLLARIGFEEPLHALPAVYFETDDGAQKA